MRASGIYGDSGSSGVNRLRGKGIGTPRGLGVSWESHHSQVTPRGLGVVKRLIYMYLTL